MHAPASLYPAVVLLTSGVLSLALAKITKISPIVGFFIIGATIGPSGFALIDNKGEVLPFLAELGVCFLLFDIGLHLSLKELRESLGKFLLSGSFQFLFSTLGLAGAAYFFGLSLAESIVLAAVLSLSSTALVLKLLADHGEQTSPAGKKATEILVFQDLVAILLLVLLSSPTGLSEGFSASSILLPIGKMLGAATFVVLLGRLALKPLFAGLISLKNDEVFTAVALLLVLVTSYFTAELGLSLALGAFLGGLALSESSYSYLVRGEISPFRGLFLSLFFLSVGMGLDLEFIWAHAFELLGFVALLFLIKALTVILALRASGQERSVSTRLGFLLSQGSEFAFVLFAVASAGGLMSKALFDYSIGIVGLSLALTPLVAGLGCYLSRSVCHLNQESDVSESDPSEVILVEFDEFATTLAGLLEHEGIPYRGHDRDVGRLTYAKSRGFNVYFSDPNRPRTIGRASTGKARAVISLVEDDMITNELVHGLKSSAPDVPFLAATKDPSRFELLLDLGVEDVFFKRELSILPLYEALLKKIGFAESAINEALEYARNLLKPEELIPRASFDSAPAENIAA